MKNKELISLAKITQIKLEIMRNCEYKSYRDISKYYLMRIESGLEGVKHGWWRDKLYAKVWLETDIRIIENYIEYHVKKEFKEKYFVGLE